MSRRCRPLRASILPVLVLPLPFLLGCGSTAWSPAAPATMAMAGKAYATGGAPLQAAPQPTQAPAGSAVAKDEAGSPGTERYDDYGVNPVTDPAKDHLSTFAVDVDTASYSIGRRFLSRGTLPPFASVRAEEFLNFFDYDYAAPKDQPLAVDVASAPSPFAPLSKDHAFVRVAIQAKKVSRAERKPVHLTYLVDTSGSMLSPDKLGLAKTSLKILTGSLKEGDTVALCTYAGSVREILPPTGIASKSKITAAIDDLSAGGSTAMASGIELAYKLAERGRVQGDINHVVVLSDGDANVGSVSHEEILKSIARYKDEGITLSTVGFGDGNYQDTMMEQLADKGDGNYSYIDSEDQAQRVFGAQVSGLLEVVAKDVKVQVDFDPAAVTSYRLIGYENRDIADKDFRNDRIDGGEVGAGHSVTALYDVVFKGAATKPSERDPITVRLRYKAPSGGASTERSFPLPSGLTYASLEAAPKSFRLAADVAVFAEVLRKSPHARGVSLAKLEGDVRAASWGKPEQSELASLIAAAARLSVQRDPEAAVKPIATR